MRPLCVTWPLKLIIFLLTLSSLPSSPRPPLQCEFVRAQLCPTLYDPADSSPQLLCPRGAPGKNIEVGSDQPTNLSKMHSDYAAGSKDFQNFPGLTCKYPSLWAWTQRGSWEVGCVAHLDLGSSSSGLPSLPYHSACTGAHMHVCARAHSHTRHPIYRGFCLCGGLRCPSTKCQPPAL